MPRMYRSSLALNAGSGIHLETPSKLASRFKFVLDPPQCVEALTVG